MKPETLEETKFERQKFSLPVTRLAFSGYQAPTRSEKLSGSEKTLSKLANIHSGFDGRNSTGSNKLNPV